MTAPRIGDVRDQLLGLVGRHRVLTRAQALRTVAEHVIDDALRSGALVSLFPGVYVLPESSSDRDILRAAALAHRPRGAISHTDALDVWGLPTSLGPSVHLTVSGGESPTRHTHLTLHRRDGFLAAAPGVLVRRGLRVVRLEQAIVESWPLLPDIDRRVPAIVAVRDRRTTGARLLRVLAANRFTAGAAEQRRVFTLTASGVHSPLELWGHDRVFSDPRLPASRCQVPVRLPTGVVYLDRLYDAELLNAELDGAAYHGQPGQRERDLRRDAALAALGYLTVRFSHQRLHRDPAGVVAELLAILATRRAQLRGVA